ncbi:MAG: hypothetical protein A2X58_00380 [Nitrospirae bacterium GWC2_56_14]|nr:MAG: hypothetical protein A2X58_00380 [Nitrospirae bacterium GWC2_56_14]
MVTALIRHTAKWTAPSPFWTADPQASTSRQNGSPWQPAILRFDNDLFMEETLSLLTYHPEGLMERIARPETWMKPMKPPVTISRNEAMEPISEFSKKIRQQDARISLPTVAAAKTVEEKDSTNADNDDEELLFKLYQPAHKRFYLVAASLVCQQAGMPDRRIDAGKRETAGFVIRRVSYKDPNAESKKEYKATDELWSEYAFIATAEGFAWKSIPIGKQEEIQTGEERLPLFAMHFNDDQGQSRRMLAGSIPVGRREEYLSAQEYVEPAKENTDVSVKREKAKTALQALFEAQVLAPWQALVQQAKMTGETMRNGKAAEQDSDFAPKHKEAVAMLKETREKIQTGSWYIMLDFAAFLERYLAQVWKELTTGKPDRKLTDQEEALIRKLRVVGVSVDLKNDLLKVTHGNPEIPSLVDALVKISDKDTAARLEAAVTPYSMDAGPVPPWPGFLFPFADPGVSVSASGSVADEPKFAGPLDISVGSAGWDSLEEELLKIDILKNLINDALAVLEELPDVAPEIQLGEQPLNPGNGWFVIRCVYERPNCGPMNPAALSAPTEKFQMAPFFDPDAPARPVRITLPMDISPAGLRKFKKSATLMMSNMLCGKVGEIRKLTFGDLVLSVLPWPFHKDLPEPGKTGPCKEGDSNGMYCSLSIPIVTLAALILLIIIVALFDMFFRWIPFLFTCFPIPGLKGKKA